MGGPPRLWITPPCMGVETHDWRMPRPHRRTELLRQLAGLGGVASGAELVHVSSWAALRACVADGSVTRVGKATYAASSISGRAVSESARSRAWSIWEEGPDEQELAVLAGRMGVARARKAALSRRCAAAARGWQLWREPAMLELAVPQGRRAWPDDPASIVRRNLTPAERAEHLTSALRTVVDCARELPFCEALAVADSSLRAGDLGQHELREAGDVYRGAAAGRVRRVTAAADGRAANPFESALRASVLDVPGFRPVPQFQITDAGFFARVDLYDPELGIVLEADSYEFHGSPERFAADRRRYTELQTRGNIVLPFTWGVVAAEPEWVRQMVHAAVLLRGRGSIR